MADGLVHSHSGITCSFRGSTAHLFSLKRAYMYSCLSFLPFLWASMKTTEFFFCPHPKHGFSGEQAMWLTSGLRWIPGLAGWQDGNRKEGSLENSLVLLPVPALVERS